MIRYILVLIIMISLNHCATTDVVGVSIGLFND